MAKEKKYKLILLEEGIVEVQFPADTVVEVALTAAIDEELGMMCGGRKVLVLCVPEGFYMVSATQRKSIAQQKERFVKAIALVSPDQKLNELHDLLHQQTVPSLPVQIFNSREPALTWLRGQK